MIKVCHMTSAHDPEDVRIFHKECVSLAKAGYEVTLVAPGSSYEKCKVTIIGAGKKAKGRLQRILFYSRAVYQRAKKINADIYHVHDPELLPYALKLKKKGKKVVFDSHELFTEQIKISPALPKRLAAAAARLYGEYERHALKKIDAVIFPCTIRGKNPFSEFCKRALIISNAALLQEMYEKYDPKAEKIKDQVCYIGSLTKERGITADIRAAAKAGVKLVLAGRFSSKKYAAELRRMPEYSCVETRGVLDRDEIRGLLAKSQIGLCTLLDEGQYQEIDTFAVKVFEYMSMGLPVILSDSNFNTKMMGRLHFGICVDPKNTDKIAAAIRFLLDNPKQAFRMGKMGRKAVKEEFNWGIEEKKLLGLYRDLTKDGKD